MNATAVAPDTDLVTPVQVAAMLGTSNRQARRICRLVSATGKGCYTKLGPGKYVWPLWAVLAVIAEAREAT